MKAEARSQARRMIRIRAHPASINEDVLRDASTVDPTHIRYAFRI